MFRILLAETIISFVVVFGLHSLRRKTSLVHPFAALTLLYTLIVALYLDREIKERGLKLEKRPVFFDIDQGKISNCGWRRRSIL